MAIERSKIRDKFKAAKNAPFTEQELKYITEAEQYIDAELEKQFDSLYGTHIDLTITQFRYSPSKKATIEDVKPYRKEAMTKELERRYKSAGWKITYHIDDGLDGPNMCGRDYMILQ